MFHLVPSFGLMAKLNNGPEKIQALGSKALNFYQSLTFLKVPGLEKEETEWPPEVSWSGQEV